MAIRLKVLDGCPVRLKTGPDETVLLQTGEGYPIYPEPYTGEYEITPTESEIGLQTNGLMMTSDVTVHGIPTDYVGSAIDRRDSSSISVSGPDVTVPLGYYEDNASVSIANGSAAVPSLNIEKNPTISVSTGGLITATVSTSETVSPVIQAGYVDSGTSGTITFSGTATQQLTVKSSSDLSVNGPTVTAPAGFYAESASRSVSNGNIGVPYIVQDAVTNHSVKLTPFYTRTQGWISESGTYSGAAVTVSASDLVSGSDTFTANNTYDVTNLASVTVEVDYSPELQTKTNIDPSLSSQTIYADEGYDGLYSVQINAMPSGTAGTPSASKGAVNNHSITVTPSVTNATGYITGGTINGTVVTVSASELVSGSQTLSDNGTYDVTNLAEVVVAVEGGGGGGTQVATKTSTPSAASSSIQFTGLSGNPTSFVVTSQADIATNTNGVTAVVFDGSSLHGQTMTTQVEADTGFTKSYSNGTLTITATSAQFQANAYKLVYTYGGSTSDIETADVQVGSGATSITFPVNGRPAYWSCIFKSDFSTSSGYQRVIAVANDGTSTYGLAMDSVANAQTSWTVSYSGGNFTINSQGTNNGGYFHQPGYYQLTYAVDDSAPSYQTKSVYATTSAQTITADNGYDALEQVDLGAISQTNLTAGNIKSGTTISISNGSTNLWSVTGTYSGGGGGSFSVATTTWNNSTNTTTSHEFTGLSGTPKFAVLRCTSQLTRSSSNTYYYIADIVWNGTAAYGNYHLRSNGSFNNVASNATTKFTVTTGTNSITFTSGGSRGGAPGAFYNGTYELTYIY